MIKFFIIPLFYPWLCGFVLLSSKKAILPVTPENPEAAFYISPSTEAPEIEKKNEYRDGSFAALDDLSLLKQLLADAMDMWNSVPAAYVTLVLKEAQDPASVKMDQEDKQNSLIVAESTNLSSAAFAKPDVIEEKIVDCDINISKKKTSAKELIFTITHELGHCLGLGHAHTNYNAIMGYSRSRKDLSLGADDIAGLIYLYPDPSYVSSEPKQLAGCGIISGKKRSSFPIFGWLFFLPLIFCGFFSSKSRLRSRL